MFCIKSDVITLGSIAMYGLVTVWTSMDDRPHWVILLVYGSHDMRHTGFRKLMVVNRTPGFLGVTMALNSKTKITSLNAKKKKIRVVNVKMKITALNAKIPK